MVQNPRDFLTALQLGELSISENEKIESALALLKSQDVRTLIEYASTHKIESSNTCFVNLINRKFHNETLLPLPSFKTAEFILVSHQPTLFPYSGVYVQFILANFIASQLQKAGRNALIVWICLDLDDSYDRRIRNSHMQNYFGRGKTTVIKYPLKKSYKNISQVAVPFYGEKIVDEWKLQIKNYVKNSIDIFPDERHSIKDFGTKMISLLEEMSSSSLLNCSNSFASFSAMMTSRFLELLELDKVYVVYFSELISVIRETFEYLINLWPTIKSSATQAIHVFDKYGIDTRTMLAMLDDPFWLICEKCGFRNTTKPETAKAHIDGTSGNITCLFCSQRLNQAYLAPKVLLEDISTTLFCSPALTLTYSGGAPHVLLSSYVLKDVFSITSPIYSWHPKQILDSTIAFPYFRSQKGLLDSTLQKAFFRGLGRDSMLLVADLSTVGELKMLWSEHFLTNSLLQPMVTAKGATLLETIKKSELTRD